MHGIIGKLGNGRVSAVHRNGRIGLRRMTELLKVSGESPEFVYQFDFHGMSEVAVAVNRGTQISSRSLQELADLARQFDPTPR